MWWRPRGWGQMWCCMPGVHSASMRSELALAGVDQPVGPRPTQGGAGLDIPPHLCSCADGPCLSAAALLLACLHVLACHLPVWGERSRWGGEQVEEAGAGHRLAVKWNVGERSRSKMMADNGVKPHTTVTVTTQSGLAPQVCLALMPLPSPWDGYRPKFAWDFAWWENITNMWVQT